MHRVYNVCRLSCHDRICGFISDRSSDRTDRSAQMGCHIQPDSVSRCYPANQAPCKGQCDRSSDVSGTSVFDVGLDSPNNMGMAVGLAVGSLLAHFFAKVHIRDTAKVLIILSISFLLVAAEDALTTAITFSALIAIMFIGIGLQKKRAVVAKRLSV